MSKFISGEDRNQSTLFPESLEDYVSEDNTVRVIDVFIEELNLAELGFKGLTLRMARVRATSFSGRGLRPLKEQKVLIPF